MRSESDCIGTPLWFAMALGKDNHTGLSLRWSMLWLVLSCFAVSSAVALELGDLSVDSEVEQILDAKVTLGDVARENLANWYVLPTDENDYQAQGLEYLKSLHDRLVMEIVTSANPPYIAVSSLVSIGLDSFDLIVRIGDGDKILSNTYRPILKEPSAPLPEIIKAMTPAEMLNYLVNKLATAQNIPAGEVWGELQLLTTATDPDGEYKFMSYLSSVNVDPRFLAGVEAMLSDYQKTVFDKARAESGDARAVATILFAQQGFLILKALFGKATESSLEEGETRSEQLDFARENAAILQNKLFALEYAKAQQDAAAQQGQADTAVGQDKKFRWSDYLQWGEQPLMTNAKFWMVVAMFLVVLLLLESLWLLKKRKALPIRQASNVGRMGAPLPGQEKLAKLRSPREYVEPPNNLPKVTADKTIGKLNQAEAYIEMGDYDKASRLLKEVERQSEDAEQLARLGSLRDKMKK
ncbi:MAG: hypothetical protein GDA45_03385 [Chromatiales bacterium]|nr:hypothetical protein [Chromatiales bacterium]